MLPLFFATCVILTEPLPRRSAACRAHFRKRTAARPKKTRDRNNREMPGTCPYFAFLCQLLEIASKLLLWLGLRNRMDRPWRHVPEAQALDQPAHTLKRLAHAEAGWVPRVDVGNRQVGQFTRVGVGICLQPRRDLRNLVAIEHRRASRKRIFA